jgi:hypothetical protein
MSIAPSSSGEADHNRWSDQCAADASSLAERLGVEGVAWLDAFLADYVFAGEPLDRVMVKARELCRLAPRAQGDFERED